MKTTTKTNVNSKAVTKKIEDTTPNETNSVESQEENTALDTNILLEENNVLKKKMEELQSQMQLLMSGLGDKGNKNSSTAKERYIPFINLSTATLILKGRSCYSLAGQFNKRSFLETEAKIIVNNMPNLVSQGYVYIADADFIQDCGLEDVYHNLLTKTQLETLLSKDASYVIEVYKNSSDGQKKIIESMVTEKRLNNHNLDANILVELGKLCNKDFINIEPIDDNEE